MGPDVLTSLLREVSLDASDAPFFRASHSGKIFMAKLNPRPASGMQAASRAPIQWMRPVRVNTTTAAMAALRPIFNQNLRF